MSATAPGSDNEGYPRPLYAWYVVGVLLIANLCCYLARMVIILLVQPINQALHITDTQVSLLQGAAFSIFFVLCGLPIGWLVDRRGRRNILFAAIVIWSVMAVLCGLAVGYGQLFLARIGVGVGEAALMPAALSIIADYFPPGRRGRAMSVFYIGALAGTGIATTLGALILRLLEGGAHLPLMESLAPWQTLFVLSGLPGFLVAFLFFTVREPKRHEAIILPAVADGKAPAFAFLRFLTAQKAVFVPVYLSLVILQYAGYAVAAWIVPLLARRDHFSNADGGATYGLMLLIVGTLSAIFGGSLGDRLADGKRTGGRFRAMVLCYLSTIPGISLLCLAATPVWAIVGLGFEVFGVAMAAATMYSVVQNFVPNQFRGQAVATLAMMATLVGATAGPTTVALLTDRLFGDPAMVGLSILVATGPFLLIGLILTLTGLAAYSRASAEFHRLAGAARQTS